MTPPPRPHQPVRLFGRGSWSETVRIGQILRSETVGGGLLVAAAVVAVVLANSPAGDAYRALRDLRIGPATLHLDLPLGAWAADGLLAVFFFLVGLELKREFVAGDLRDPRKALVPVAAAIGGVATPALVYALINLAQPETLRGWAIPTATDIAFALAVLAVLGSHLPGALRTFLLTLAVVDDLIAIVIIAVFYTDHIEVLPLLATALPLAVYALLVRTFRRFFATRAWALWVVLLPLGAAAWALLHASGVHATIAGVALGLTVPVLRRDGRADVPGLAETFEHRLRPLSAGVAVPVFAFFAAGVEVGGAAGLASAFADPVTLGIVAGLVVGKPLGILGATWLVTRVTRARLDDAVTWIDVTGLGLLGGIGFTVSLLVNELSFDAGGARTHGTVGVLAASVCAALLAAAVLAPRDRHYRALEQEETRDDDGDGVPDVYDAR